MFIKILMKTLKQALNNATDENRYLRRELIKQLEDSIMTINQIQDIQVIEITEREKDINRNVIINKKRIEYVDKIIELDKLCKPSNSSN